MKIIEFYLDPEANGTNVELVGTLDPAGNFTGNDFLKADVERTIKKHNLDLTKPEDRQHLMEIFGGQRLWSAERQNE